MDRLPVLLIANLHGIRCTSLSGSASRLSVPYTNQTMAMDFVYAEETVCWIDVGDSPAATQLKCTSIQDLKANSTSIRPVNITLSLHRKCIFLSSLSGRKCKKHIQTFMFCFYFFLVTFNLLRSTISLNFVTSHFVTQSYTIINLAGKTLS